MRVQAEPEGGNLALDTMRSAKTNGVAAALLVSAAGSLRLPAPADPGWPCGVMDAKQWQVNGSLGVNSPGGAQENQGRPKSRRPGLEGVAAGQPSPNLAIL